MLTRRRTFLRLRTDLPYLLLPRLVPVDLSLQLLLFLPVGQSLRLLRLVPVDLSLRYLPLHLSVKQYTVLLFFLHFQAVQAIPDTLIYQSVFGAVAPVGPFSPCGPIIDPKSTSLAMFFSFLSLKKLFYNKKHPPKPVLSIL